MLTGKQSALITGESGCSIETIPLRFIATSDGRTLLALTENEDGVLDIMTTPITLTSSNSGSASLIKRVDGNVIVHPPVFQINMEDVSYSDGGNSTSSWIQEGISLVSAQAMQGAVPVVLESPVCANISYDQTLQPVAPQEDITSAERNTSTSVQGPVHGEHEKCKGSPGRPKKSEIHLTEGAETLRCNICQQRFNKQILYRKHMENHAEEKPHRCPKCSASFNIPTNFTLHMATHNNGDPKCPECGRKFARMASLKSHILLHEKEENLFCTECEDAFSTKAQLDAHLKLHGEKWSNEEARKCKLCNKQFTQPALYKLHIREHYRLQTRVAKQTKKGAKHKTMYKCTICLKSFQKPSHLMRHIRVHTGEKPFKCTICGRAFTQKSSLQIHTWQHNGIRPHTCDFCNAKFSQKGNLNAHILRVHNAPEGEPIFGCTYCSCVFKKFGSLNGHIKRMHSNINEESNNKDESAKVESDMQATVHSVMSQLASLESGTNEAATESRLESATGNDILQQALRNSGLSSKNKISSDEGILETNKVEARTNFVTLLDRTPDGSTRKYLTIRQRCIGNVRWYACSFCQKEFKKPSDLIRHLRVHTQEKPFKCTHCCRSFALKSTMIAHERTHTGTKKYICESCNKIFACHGSLVAHNRLQHGKPDTCEEKWTDANDETAKYLKKGISKAKSRLSTEAKSLVTQVVLQEPLVITETENRISVAQVASKQKRSYELGAPNDVARPHRCWVCHAAFRKVSHLKQHYRRHTGERPYKCSTCDRRFTSNSVLKSHLHTHEDSRPYSCPVCGTKFSTQSSMKRHLVTHSNKRPFMCPYCHKTFKTYVNCRKHMKIHKQELAQRQLEQQQTQEEKEVVSVLPENLNLTDSINISFQPEVGQDFPQNFPEQLECLTENKTKPLIATDPVTSTIANQSLENTSTATLEESQMLHADETGTVTIPSYSSDQTLTPDSIREIEETLNQQLFSIGMNLGLGNNLVRQIEDGNSNVRDQRVFNVIYESNKNNESSGNNVFGSQFDSFDMSQIALQGGTGIDLGLVDATTSTNMASILPRSVKEEHRFIPMSVATSDSTVTNTTGTATVTTTTASITTEMNIDHSDDMSTRAIFFDTKDSSVRRDLFKNSPANIQTHEAILVETNVASCESDPDITPFVEKFQDTIESSAGTNSVIGPLNVSSVCGPNEVDPTTVTRYESLLQCHMCSEQGFTATGLKEHLKSHHGEKEYQCSECSLRFCTNGGLSRHAKVHGGKQLWKCTVCQKILSSKAQLRLHSKSHDLGWSSQLTEPGTIPTEVAVESVPVTVIDPDSSISEKVLLDTVAEKEVMDRNGISEKKERKEYTNRCKFCPKTFRKPSDLIRHTRTHTGERPYKCDYCSKSFAVKCTLDSHMKVHTGKKTFRCHVCSSLFATKGSLKVHMRLHTGSKPFRCSICDLRFRTSGHRKVHLLKHLREYKPGSPKRKQKHLKVAAIAEAAAHLEKPTKEKKPEQEQEDRIQNGIEFQNFEAIDIEAAPGLTDQINFNADTAILNNNSILSINDSNQLVANLHFLLANGLVTIQTEDTVLPQSSGDVSEPQAAETHVLVASFEPETSTENGQSTEGLRATEIRGQARAVEEPANHARRRNTTVKSVPSKKQCDVCGKAFTKPYQLERHRRIHTGERPYKCDLCVKSFAQKSTLQMHQKHHTGDRPYPCPHCEYSFTQKGNLRTHVKRVHQLDTLDIKKLRRVRGHSYAPKTVLPDNLSDQKILSFDDISFVEFLK